MVQHQDNFAELVDFDPILTEIFFQHYEAVTNPLWGMINRRPTSKDKETDIRIGQFGDPVPFVSKVEYKTAVKDYSIEYVPVEYALGFQITRRMKDTMQYERIFSQAENLALSFRRLEDKKLTGVFNDAFTTLGYDAKALCANDHPQSLTDASAIDNALAVSLTADNLETAINQLEALGTDIDDEPESGAQANVLIYGRNNRRRAKELIDSELTPENANNATNIFNEMLTGVYLPRLSGNKWFVADAAMLRRYLKWYDLTGQEFAAEDDFDTLIRKYRGYTAYVVGWSDFRWVVGSNP